MRGRRRRKRVRESIIDFLGFRLAVLGGGRFG